MPGFYKDAAGHVLGPVSTADIKTLVRQGVVTRDTLLSRNQAGPWQRAGDLGGLKEAFASGGAMLTPAAVQASAVALSCVAATPKPTARLRSWPKLSDFLKRVGTIRFAPRLTTSRGLIASVVLGMCLTGLLFSWTGLSVLQGGDKQDALVDKNASKKLQDNIVRVARGSEPDPGWAIQAVHRGLKAYGLDPASSLGCMLHAYQRGLCEWTEPDGSLRRISSIGLHDCDWRQTKFMPACIDEDADEEPTVLVEREAAGTRATLAPIAIAEDLRCGISFLVIENSPEQSRAAGLDFLAVQVELFGGSLWPPKSSPIVRRDTFVDFWSSTKNKRYTITRWRANSPVGHITQQTYGPLLFEVLDSDPDFMFVENVKIALSPRFRAGCRRLCDEVRALRRGQGQTNPPVCQKP